MRLCGAGLICIALFAALAPSGASARLFPHPRVTPMVSVIAVRIIPVVRAAAVLHALYPHAQIRIDRHANALVVLAPAAQVQAMRTVVQGIDVKNPSRPQVQVIQLHAVPAASLVGRLRGLFPGTQIEASTRTSLLIRAAPLAMEQIKALIASLDQVTATPMPTAMPVTPVRIAHANAKVVARALVHELGHLRASVSGATILLEGPADVVAKATTLAQALDVRPADATYTQLYRLENVDARSVGALIARSYPTVHVHVDESLNALSIRATAVQQAAIAAAIAQLDASQAPGAGGGPALDSANIAVVRLNEAIPGQNGAPSTTASDIATAVTQLLGQMAPDLRIAVPANSAEILLAGSPMSIRLAKALIAKLDRPQPLVVLDTEVVEVDESVARNVGLELPSAALSTTFSEISPPTDPTTGLPGRLIRLQPVTRTPLQLTAVLNLLIQQGNARVLADPRITTLSGHTATIRAGDTLAILTQAGGGVGTPVTQQLQTFNTGVTLDITPMVGADGTITVLLHPVVNSLSGVLNGVPQISTRDTQTTVALRNNQTLVIGGLIQDERQRTVSKIPFLGDLPLIGKLFDNSSFNDTRNELIIVVTPHIVGEGKTPVPQALLPIPTPQPLPTLPPGTVLPIPSSARPRPWPTPGAPQLFTPVPSASPEPVPTPTAFVNANVFTYGSAPVNAYARSSAPPQIFYVRFDPTILRSGVPVQISVLTTTNVQRVTVGYPGYLTTLSQVGPGKWQAAYSFNAAGLSSAQNNTLLTLSAYRADGVAASVQIPVSLAP
ncbi:MAG: secretin N-terminal domain-containing protein [Vulcanimicrobiaceae bacterium]